LRKLAERHGLLPDRIKIKENIEVSNQVLGSGGFGDVRLGTYEGGPVAVKIMKVSAPDKFARIRKVSINVDHPGPGLSYPATALLQGSRPLEHAIPPERFETRWGSKMHKETAAHYRVRVHGGREHHGVYQQESHQQTGAGASPRDRSPRQFSC